MKGRQIPGTVSRQPGTPRSYLVETPSGQVCRNHNHLRKVPLTRLKLNQYKYQVQLTPVYILEQQFNLQIDLICSSEGEVYNVDRLTVYTCVCRLF